MVGVGGLQNFSVSPRPLCFRSLGLGLRGLGPGLDNKQANPTAVLYSYLVEPDTYFNTFLLSAAKNAAEVGNMAN